MCMVDDHIIVRSLEVTTEWESEYPCCSPVGCCRTYMWDSQISNHYQQLSQQIKLIPRKFTWKKTLCNHAKMPYLMQFDKGIDPLKISSHDSWWFLEGIVGILSIFSRIAMNLCGYQCKITQKMHRQNNLHLDSILFQLWFLQTFFMAQGHIETLYFSYKQFWMV